MNVSILAADVLAKDLERDQIAEARERFLQRGGQIDKREIIQRDPHTGSWSEMHAREILAAGKDKAEDLAALQARQKELEERIRRAERAAERVAARRASK